MITEKDEDIFDQELIGILGDLYDQIDAAFADAYGWPVDLSDEDILLRLVALNKERAVQETLGHIRWLRLDYQNPTGQQAAKGKTADIDLGVVAKIEKAPLAPNPTRTNRPPFVWGRAVTVSTLLDSLAALRQAVRFEEGALCGLTQLVGSRLLE